MKKLILLIAILILPVISAHAQQRTSLRDTGESLRGISELSVAVILVGDAEGKLSKSTLQNFLEMRLREAGIRVANSEQSPELILIINAIKRKSVDLYALCVDLRVSQDVTLDRNPSIKSSATTWEMFKMLIRGEDNLKNIQDGLQGPMDYFINDFLRVNPK
jgi:hypothetical protein